MVAKLTDKVKKIVDKQKEEYLIALVRETYKQGDNYYASRVKGGETWACGYTNDYPLQHGVGVNVMIPDAVVSVLMERAKTAAANAHKSMNA